MFSDQRRLIASLLASLLMVPCGCSQSTPTAVDSAPPKVTVSHPELRELTDYDEFNGWTASSHIVEVRSRVRGHIVKINFTDGETVDVGKILFELDPQPFDSEVGRAKGQLNVAEAQQVQAVSEEARQARLLEQQATTQQQFEVAVATRKTWEAQVASAKDEVKRKELDADYAKIDAPIRGKIGRALLTEGNLVNVGGAEPLLTTIVAMDPINIFFNVDERSMIRFRERRSANNAEPKPFEQAKIPFDFQLETDESFSKSGTLDFADNRIDAATGTIEVRGKADNPDGKLVPGGRVRVRVSVSEPYKGLLVPDTAILTDQDKKYLLCLGEKNVVLRRDVKLGKLLDDGMRVVLPPNAKAETLTPEDRIIVLGLQRAKLNYPVEPVDQDGKQIAVQK